MRGRVLTALARVHLALGNTSEAADHATEATTIHQTAGATLHLSEARALLATIQPT